MLSSDSCAELFRQACEVELQAFKPGNVSVYSAAHDMTVEDFRLSAAVSAAPISRADYCLGEKIFYAVKATRDAVACNTNLGIILLAAPLLQAAMHRESGQSLREALAVVLENTTVEDADWVFRAITLAAPGGLGDAPQQDVKQAAAVTLKQAMALAADRDRIAMQFITCFKDVFDFTVLHYNRSFVCCGDSSWAALMVFCELLTVFPDSHIERKYGKRYSEWIAAEMGLLCKAMCNADRLDDVLPKLYELDGTLKAKRINPGTTADITVAVVLTALIEQRIGNADYPYVAEQIVQ
jgi:triphosphoribosyl-dephospho-CoA synthase